MKQCDVLFLGTPAFACPSLRALHDHPAIRVIHVITQPDRPAGRGKVITASPVKLLSQSLKIPVLQPEDVNTARDVLDLHCDVMVVVAYGQILRQELLDLPSIAPVNLHASLLPRWRGASPIEHAILHGDTKTGVTIQRMVRALDAGPILDQKVITLTENETSPALRDLLAEEGATLLASTVSALSEGNSTETMQDETAVTQCGKFTKSDGDCDHTKLRAEDIHRMLRAFDPWPGVRLRLHGKEVKLIAASLLPTDGSVPMVCNDETVLYLQKLQAPSLRPVLAREWLQVHAPDFLQQQ